MSRMMTNPAFRPGNLQRPIFIANNGYVIDGHHTWAATFGRDLADGTLGNGGPIAVAEVDAAIDRIIPWAVRWATEFGLPCMGLQG